MHLYAKKAANTIMHCMHNAVSPGLDITLCSWGRHITLIVPLSTQVYLTIRPVAPKGYRSIAHEAKPNGLLTRGP